MNGKQICTRNWLAISHLILASALAHLPVSSSIAQEVTTAEKLIEQLAVEPVRYKRTRGIAVNAASPDQGRASFNTIQFEHDSERLTQASTVQLDELGKALANDRLINESFVIEGHADAYGDDQYNKDLSLRRAMIVKEFLATQAGIAEERLQVIGKGEDEPRTDDPYDPENRRVDIVNLKIYE